MFVIANKCDINKSIFLAPLTDEQKALHCMHASQRASNLRDAANKILEEREYYKPAHEKRAFLERREPAQKKRKTKKNSE